MAHVFNYSGSTAPDRDQYFLEVSLDDLFGGVSGQVLPTAFWGTGNVRKTVSYYTDLEQTATATHTVSIGTTGYHNLDNSFAQDAKPTPASFMQGQADFTIADVVYSYSGSYLRLQGVAAPTINLDLQDGTYADFNAVRQAVEQTYVALHLDYREQLNAIFDTPMNTHAGIEVQKWSRTAPDSPEYVMTYTPDGDTGLTVGDFFQTGPLNGEDGEYTAFIMSVERSRAIFAREDVEIVLSDDADALSNYATGSASFTSASLDIAMGAGDDAANLNLSDGTDQADFTPARPITIAGEAGNDTVMIAVNARDALSLTGGAGDDDLTVQVEAAAKDSATRDQVVDARSRILDGGDGNDRILGSVLSDTLRGGDGNDTIWGNLDSLNRFTQAGDTFEGGAGDDALIGGTGDDVMMGGGGNDRFSSNLGDDLLIGGEGEDSYNFSVGSFSGNSPGSSGVFGFGNDTLRDTGGYIDVLSGGGVADLGFERQADDLLIRFNADSTLLLEDFYIAPEAWVLRGIDANGPSERLALLDMDDARALGIDGTDAPLAATEGPDIVVLTSPALYDAKGGHDRVTGSAGDDVLRGGAGHDTLDGAAGNDTLNGGEGLDRLIGGAGDDVLVGGYSEADRRDVIYGGDGNDLIDGGYGNDELRGDAGDDTIAGGFGGDTIIGGTGDDVLSGGALGDIIFGGDGDDYINGGFGHDRLNGGAGADEFFHLGIFDHGSDWVQDYNADDGDVLVFGNANATRDQFQINTTATPDAGADGIEEAFVIYRPTGQIMWALIDGGGQAEINLRIGGDIFDLTA